MRGVVRRPICFAASIRSDGEGRRRHVLGSVRPVECRPLALRQRAGEQLLPCVELYAGLSASQPQAGREMSLSMRFLTTFALAVVTMAAPALAQPKYPFQDPALDPEKRIDNAQIGRAHV